jgi:hypothetical protein
MKTEEKESLKINTEATAGQPQPKREKTEIEKKFDILVSHVFTFFKPLGYKKKGNNFRFYDKEIEFGKIINFQKSIYYNKQHIHFTINASVYFSDYEYYMWGKKTHENFTEPSCVIRDRIGSWYDLNEETDFEKLKEQLERDFKKIISYFNKIRTREDVINQIIINAKVYGIYGYGIIKTLFYNGQKERALNLFEQAMKQASKEYIPTLEKLKQELLQNE